MSILHYLDLDFAALRNVNSNDLTSRLFGKLSEYCETVDEVDDSPQARQNETLTLTPNQTLAVSFNVILWER